MSDKFYVLMEAGFEYNDEYYFRHDGTGGHPEKVFLDKKAAEDAALQKGLERFKKLIKSAEIRDYGYGLDGLINSEVTEEDFMYEEGIFMQLFGFTAEEWWDSLCDTEKVKLKVEPTDEQWEKLYNCFNLNFYEVVVVEKG